MVARMAQLTGPAERAFLDKLLQVAGRRGPRCLADADVVFRAQSALEAVDALAEHAGNHFFLTVIERAAVLFIELCLGDVEINAPDRVALRFQNSFCEINEPVRDDGILVIALQRVVISLARALDRVRERDQSRLAEVLRERFFSKGAPDTPVAVLKRMNADKVKMRDAGARQRRQCVRARALGRVFIEPFHEAVHFRFHL